VRVLFERFDRHERAAFAQREPRFGAARRVAASLAMIDAISSLD
jgi:hypothetical protein